MPGQGPITDPSMTLIVQVDPGDTFASIATQFGCDEGQLRARNPGSTLTPGDELLVPAEATMVRTEPGDTFTTVAAQFNTTPARIKAANPDVSTLTPGTILTIL